MSRFLSEAADFTDVPPPPQTIDDLVRALGIADAPAPQRRSAIRQWLRANTPTPLLAAGLELSGYLPPHGGTRGRP